MTPATIRRIVHVSETELDVRTGMGRVAFHWKRAFEGRDVEFIHFGPVRVGRGLHKALWHRAAVRAVERSGLKPDLVIAHEPVSFAFKERGFRTVVVSHVPERRGGEVLRPITPRPPTWPARIRRRVLDRTLWSWRGRQCDLGLRHGDLVLVSNRSDAEYVCSYYGRQEKDVFIFRNGVDPVADVPVDHLAAPNILFYASWVPRKGTATLMDAVLQLRQEQVAFRVIACTGMNLGQKLEGWPETLDDALVVVPRIEQAEEYQLFARARIFVLPSWVEGQPLALLQAMAYGRCCVVSDIPGHADFIAHGRTGFKFAPGEAGELARVLRRCLEDPALCQRIGAAAAESVRDRSWACVSDEVATRVLASRS